MNEIEYFFIFVETDQALQDGVELRTLQGGAKAARPANAQRGVLRAPALTQCWPHEIDQGCE